MNCLLKEIKTIKGVYIMCRVMSILSATGMSHLMNHIQEPTIVWLEVDAYERICTSFIRIAGVEKIMTTAEIKTILDFQLSNLHSAWGDTVEQFVKSVIEIHPICKILLCSYVELQELFYDVSINLHWNRNKTYSHIF